MDQSESSNLEYSCYTEPGRQRSDNEDACATPPATANVDRYGALFVLADGVGGYPGGAEASQQAVHSMQALYYADIGSQHPADRLQACVESVNALARLEKERSGLEKGYLTTLVAVVAFQDQVWVANVGDSRAYLIEGTGKKRRQLTEDHSSFVRLVKSGLTTDADIERTSSMITRAIGLEEHCQVDTYHYTWQPGDHLVLCSDGMVSVPEDEMVSFVLDTPPSSAARQLVGRAVELDGSDNCTAVVIGRELNKVGEIEKETILHPNPISHTIPVRNPPEVEHPSRRLLPLVLTWFILGILIGWVSALALAVIWLNSTGKLNLF